MLLLAAAPQAINVDVDLTFLVQLVLFVGLTLVLKPMLFDPMLKLFEEREKRIDGAKLQARKIDEKSASALAEVRGRDGQGARGRRARTATGSGPRRVKREQEILAHRARVDAARSLDDGKRAAQAEAERARAALKAEADDAGPRAGQPRPRPRGAVVKRRR